MLFSEPKIPQFRRRAASLMLIVLSVLFSEPKIPQCAEGHLVQRLRKGTFSALQRAENSSMRTDTGNNRASGAAFSALQRAENSSICSIRTRATTSPALSVLFSEPKIPQSTKRAGLVAPQRNFQCSSASRKFLNRCA